jgi:Metallo-peptidase family M12B Reprolysin-like
MTMTFRSTHLFIVANLCLASVCFAAPDDVSRRGIAELPRTFESESQQQSISVTRSLVKFDGRTKSLTATLRSVEQIDEAVAARNLPAGGHIASFLASDLLAAKPGDTYRFGVPNRREIRLRTEKLVTLPSGGHVWVGIDEADDSAARRAFISIVDGAVSGFVQSSESYFELVDGASLASVDNGDARPVYVVDYAASGQSRAYGFAADAIAPPPLAMRPMWMQEEARLAREAAARSSDLKAAPSPQSTIDIMVAYTAGMVTRHGSAAGVVARINTLIQFANSSYSGSEVAITLNLVHSVQVSYPDGGSNGTALNELTGSNGQSSVAIPASLSGIATLRNTYGADLVALLRPYQSSSHGGCGIAWIGGFNVSNIGDDSPFGYSVTSSGNSTSGGGSFCSDSAFTHELGHNMGLMHDRANAVDTQGNLQRGATLYAYGYTLPSTNIGDIMSYAQDESPRFSSPSLGCSGTNCTVGGGGTALGVAANTPQESCIASSAGCVASQASACSFNPSSCADAARALNFTRVKVAQFRPTASSGGLPTISGSISLSAGGSVPAGTTICADPPSGVSCGSATGGSYSCTVPSGWTGTLHLQAGNNLRVAAKRFTSGVTTAQSGQNFTAYNADAALNSYAYLCNLDIDNNGLNEASIDGVMMMRKLLGVTGTAQTVSASGVCAQRTNASDRVAFLADQNYDINNDSFARPLRDGLILLRLMLGMTGAQAVVGTGLTWTNVQTQLNNNCGTSF